MEDLKHRVLEEGRHFLFEVLDNEQQDFNQSLPEALVQPQLEPEAEAEQSDHAVRSDADRDAQPDEPAKDLPVQVQSEQPQQKKQDRVSQILHRALHHVPAEVQRVPVQSHGAAEAIQPIFQQHLK